MNKERGERYREKPGNQTFTFDTASASFCAFITQLTVKSDLNLSLSLKIRN